MYTHHIFLYNCVLSSAIRLNLIFNFLLNVRVQRPMSAFLENHDDEGREREERKEKRKGKKRIRKEKSLTL